MYSWYNNWKANDLSEYPQILENYNLAESNMNQGNYQIAAMYMRKTAEEILKNIFLKYSDEKYHLDAMIRILGDARVLETASVENYNKIRFSGNSAAHTSYKINSYDAKSNFNLLKTEIGKFIYNYSNISKATNKDNIVIRKMIDYEYKDLETQSQKIGRLVTKYPFLKLKSPRPAAAISPERMIVSGSKKHTRKNSFALNYLVLPVLIIVCFVYVWKVMNADTLRISDDLHTNIEQWETDDVQRETDEVKKEADVVKEGESENVQQTSNLIPEDAVSYLVTATSLNIRENASADSRVLGTLASGEQCHATGKVAENGKWIEIYLKDKEGTGWVSTNYITSGSEFIHLNENRNTDIYKKYQNEMDQAIEDFVEDWFNTKKISVGESIVPRVAQGWGQNNIQTFSSNEAVAYVTETGKITGMAPGVAYIFIISEISMRVSDSLGTGIMFDLIKCIVS